MNDVGIPVKGHLGFRISRECLISSEGFLVDPKGKAFFKDVVGHC